jgi:hypothetical protein
LGGVSCTSATACTAVGYYLNASNVYVTLAERWNGTAWAVQPIPNPAGATSYQSLYGVSCTSATACTAVGNYHNASGVYVTMAEQWNGTAWAVQPTPNPAGANLYGVSCTSGTACTAVGSYLNTRGVTVTLVERWNGTVWAIQSTPNRAGAKLSSLHGVSCTSATACTAIGDFGNATSVSAPFGERWNGTAWAMQSTPNPAGATQSYLHGVSCTSVTACTAIGDFGNASNVWVTLAERHS